MLFSQKNHAYFSRYLSFPIFWSSFRPKDYDVITIITIHSKVHSYIIILSIHKNWTESRKHNTEAFPQNLKVFSGLGNSFTPFRKTRNALLLEKHCYIF